jgi:hypothetical protein
VDSDFGATRESRQKICPKNFPAQKKYFEQIFAKRE